MGRFKKGDEVVIKGDATNYVVLYLFYKDSYFISFEKRMELEKGNINRDINSLVGIISHRKRDSGNKKYDSYCIKFNYKNIDFYTPLPDIFLDYSYKKIREDKLNELLND